ncbi:MAG: SRPBCC family protein [Pseudonocardiaceae bacterium]
MTSTGKPASTAGRTAPLPEPAGKPDLRGGSVGSTGAEERIVVAAPPAEVFAAVADIRRMARWSPECFAVWIWRKHNGLPARFIGWNRHGPRIWFSSCHVCVAEPGAEFVFDVFALGFPVARWGYRFAPTEGGTEVTEYWSDKRTRGASILGRIVMGKLANIRPEANRDGMRQTLRRLKTELESAAKS